MTRQSFMYVPDNGGEFPYRPPRANTVQILGGDSTGARDEWQLEVVEIAQQTVTAVGLAQRPHKRRRRSRGGSSIRWGRAIALGTFLGPITGALIVRLT